MPLTPDEFEAECAMTPRQVKNAAIVRHIEEALDENTRAMATILARRVTTDLDSTLGDIADEALRERRARWS